MEEFKQGDTAWICAVFTKTKSRSKVQCLVSRVTITRLFEEDNTCLITDEEGIGIHCKVMDLFLIKKEALDDAFKGLNRWLEMER